MGEKNKRKPSRATKRILDWVEKLDCMKYDSSTNPDYIPPEEVERRKKLEAQRNKIRSQKKKEKKKTLSIKDKVNAQNLFVRGIYYLYDKGAIVYIGMSTSNCMKRICDHFDDNKKFDHFKIVEIENKSNKQLLSIEASLIKKHKPKYNKVHKKKPKGKPFYVLHK